MEEPLYSSHKSWNYYLPGLLLLSLLYWAGDIGLFISSEFFYLLGAALHRRYTHYALFEDRVVLRRGLFNRSITELRICDIREVKVRQGTMGFMCDYGHVDFVAHSGEVITFKGVKDPDGVRKKALGLIEG